MHLGTERCDDAPFRRPRQATAERGEPGAGRLEAGLGRRHPGQTALPGLQIPDEGFEATSRVGELADHAFVVGALVTHPGEEGAAFGGVTVDFGLFTLGVGLEIGQLTLAGLLPAAAILQPI